MKTRPGIIAIMLLLLLLTLSATQAQVFIASISATSETEVCAGEAVGIRISFWGGVAPYDVTISDNQGIYLELKDIYSPHDFNIYPEEDNRLYISAVTDSRGRKGYKTGSVSVNIIEPSPLSIISDRRAFLDDEAAHELISKPLGAVFEGPGVRNNLFYPSEAGTASSPHLIRASRSDGNGCLSEAEISFYVLSGEANVRIGDGSLNTLCDEDTPYLIRAENEDGLSGSFTLYEKGSNQPVNGHIIDDDPFDNEALLDGEGLDGDYQIRYSYGIYELEIVSSVDFVFQPVRVSGLENFPERICRDADPVPLQPLASPPDPDATWLFSGPGVTGNQSSGFSFDPSAEGVTTGINEIQLIYYSSLGCSTQAGFTIDVGERTDMDFSPGRLAFLESEGAYTLTANPPGASFSGPGVEGNKFYPSDAGWEDSPHLLHAMLINAYGCESHDSALVYVLSGQAEVALYAAGNPVDTICDENTLYTISGSNADGLSGQFELYLPEGADPIPGHVIDEDPDDNEAELSAAGLEGPYEIQYSYGIHGLEISVRHSFLFLPLQIEGLLNFPDSLCRYEESIPLIPVLATADPGATWSFSGPGVEENPDGSYQFNPAHDSVQDGENEILLEYISSENCRAWSIFTIYISHVPAPYFIPESVCLSDGGDSTIFLNLSPEPGKVAGWFWDFGDPESGEANFSSVERGAHVYPGPGSYNISLSAISSDGCAATYNIDTLLEGRPVVEMLRASDCYSALGGLQLSTLTGTPYSPPRHFHWNIYNAQGILMDNITRDYPDSSLVYHFPDAGVYEVSLELQTTSDCRADTSSRFELFPSIVLSDSGFFEDFNTLPASWMHGSDSDSSSWVLGEPDFPGTVIPPGDLAWYTRLPESEEYYLERSWVQSPCFDFSELERPVLELDIMKSFVPGVDGTVFQFRNGFGGRWKTLGSVTSGVNWYNDTAIYHKPGGGSSGWSLEVFDPDREWLKARHDLYELAGRQGIKFRIALASGPSKELTSGKWNKGFAFDNFGIREARSRKSVLEYFTNTGSEDIHTIDTLVGSVGKRYRGLVYDLHYHMDYPGIDPMNMDNPQPPSSRSFHHGIPDVPFAVLNGGSSPVERFDLFEGPEEMDENGLILASLDEAAFQIDLEANYLADRIEGQASISFSGSFYYAFVQLYLVVIEKEVSHYPTYSPDSTFRNVVLDMIPSPAGQLLKDNWASGESMQVEFSWPYAAYVEDIEDLSVVAFIQDRDNGIILQATAAPHSPDVSSRQRQYTPQELAVYPNPTTGLIQVSLDPGHEDGFLELMDLSGRVLLIWDVQAGRSRHQLDLDELPQGMYLLSWTENGRQAAQVKVVVR